MTTIQPTSGFKFHAQDLETQKKLRYNLMLQKAKFRCINSELTGIKKIRKNSQVLLDFNIFKV